MVTHNQELADKTEKLIYIEDGSIKRGPPLKDCYRESIV
jgi:ABC-type lipoprotein export system ATPase subunit